MTDYGDGVAVWHLVFFGDERAPLVRRHAEHVEVVSRNDLPPDLFDLVWTTQFVLPDAVSGELGENFVTLAEVEVTRIRAGLIGLLRIAAVEFDDLLRIRQRTRTQKQRVDDAEDRRVCANADRERDHREHGDAFALPKHLDGVTKIADEDV